MYKLFALIFDKKSGMFLILQLHINIILLYSLLIKDLFVLFLEILIAPLQYKRIKRLVLL